MPETQKDTDAELLESFFAAARSSDPQPGTDLLNAVLADAARVSAHRAEEAAARAPMRARTRPGGLGAFLQRGLAALGGWRAATALAVCTFVGFGVGLTGSVDLASELLWGTETSYSAADTGVTEFFDLALTEG